MCVEYKNFVLQKIMNGPLQNNSYLLKIGTKCVVIDPASKLVAKKVEEQNLTPIAVLLTHGHFDHIKGVEEFRALGVPVYIHELDNPKCTGEQMPNLLERFRIKPFSCDKFVNDGDILDFDGLKIKVLHTPGHSAGGVCYIVENAIFSGDTLFLDSYGRYDFSDSSFKDLKSSIVEKLFNLEGNYNVYPGHGENTTLLNEKKGNMILWS